MTSYYSFVIFPTLEQASFCVRFPDCSVAAGNHAAIEDLFRCASWNMSNNATVFAFGMCRRGCGQTTTRQTGHGEFGEVRTRVFNNRLHRLKETHQAWQRKEEEVASDENYKYSTMFSRKSTAGNRSEIQLEE